MSRFSRVFFVFYSFAIHHLACVHSSYELLNCLLSVFSWQWSNNSYLFNTFYYLFNSPSWRLWLSSLPFSSSNFYLFILLLFFYKPFRFESFISFSLSSPCPTFLSSHFPFCSQSFSISTDSSKWLAIGKCQWGIIAPVSEQCGACQTTIFYFPLQFCFFLFSNLPAEKPEVRQTAIVRVSRNQNTSQIPALAKCELMTKLRVYSHYHSGKINQLYHWTAISWINDSLYIWH